jgi:hypothetical protein
VLLANECELNLSVQRVFGPIVSVDEVNAVLRGNPDPVVALVILLRISGPQQLSAEASLFVRAVYCRVSVSPF